MHAMRQAITNGAQHVRPVLDEVQFARYVETGLALRAAFRTPPLRERFLARLKPHRGLIAGSVPAGIERHGMLPARAPRCTLDDIAETELVQWLVDDARLIYGEFSQEELDNYFAAVAPLLPPQGHFIDLGSGLGKVVLSAALAFPGMRCTGVELLGYRHAMAQARLAAMLAAGAAEDPRAADSVGARVRLLQQDLFATDVSDATLVYIYSTCFASLMGRLAEKLASEMRPGAMVTTVTVPLQHPSFELVRHFAPQEVAWSTVFLYRRREAAAPPAQAAWAGRPYEPDGAAWEAAVRAAFAAYDAAGGA
jgi:hypothetical protein